MSQTQKPALGEQALCEELLKNVYDPEMGVNIVDLGLIRRIDVNNGIAEVEMTLTTPACPAGPALVQEVRQRLASLKTIREVEVKLVWSPPWTPEQMTEEARDELGLF